MPHLNANGIRHHYRLDGPEDGAVLMLSNSLASDLSMWELQVPALTAAGFRVLRYDSRGHGQSDAPPGPYSIGQLTDDAVGLLDALEVERAHFCGLSKGGMIGQALGTLHGDRLISLTLCDTTAHIGQAVPWEERMRAVREGGMAAVVDTTVERWLTAEGRARRPEWEQNIRRMILDTPVEGYCASAMAIQEMDQRETIRAITVPTHVVVGREDNATPVEAARLLHERIGGSRLTVLPQAAHLANVDQPEAFDAALLEFLQAHR